MHIADGILPAGLTIGSHVASGIVLVLTTKNAEKQEIPKISLFTAMFFIASLIHIPIPPTSVHLVLCGLIGIILGKYSFSAIWVGLLFQAIMFQHGGILSLGVNALNFGIPALLSYLIFNLFKKRFKNSNFLAFLAAIISFAAIILAAFLLSIELYITEKSFSLLITGFLIGTAVTAIIDAIIAFFVIKILNKYYPYMLNNQKKTGESQTG